MNTEVIFRLPPAILPRASRAYALRSDMHRKARAEAYFAAIAAGAPELHDGGGAAVSFVRVQRSGRADSDNLAAAFKHQRDGVLDAMYRYCRRHTVRPCGHHHDGPGSPVTVHYAARVARADTPHTLVHIDEPREPAADVERR